MRPQPMIAVTDVEASSRWYQQLLGCQSAHGGPEYERLVFNGNLVMQLHSFEVEHHHGRIGDPDDRPYGNGVLLWFEVDDFDAALDRAGPVAGRARAAPPSQPALGRGGAGPLGMLAPGSGRLHSCPGQPRLDSGLSPAQAPALQEEAGRWEVQT
jgi:catechol 2,3-dioxygenase-like lactoylglutathione lyase family enzyme